MLSHHCLAKSGSPRQLHCRKRVPVSISWTPGLRFCSLEAEPKSGCLFQWFGGLRFQEGEVRRSAQGRENIARGCDQLQPGPRGALEHEWYLRVDPAWDTGLAGWQSVIGQHQPRKGALGQKGVSGFELSADTHSPGCTCSVKGLGVRREHCTVPVSAGESSLKERSARGRKKYAGLEILCRQCLYLGVTDPPPRKCRSANWLYPPALASNLPFHFAASLPRRVILQ